jgi:hypothetical protein
MGARSAGHFGHARLQRFGVRVERGALFFISSFFDNFPKFVPLFSLTRFFTLESV